MVSIHNKYILMYYSIYSTTGQYAQGSFFNYVDKTRQVSGTGNVNGKYAEISYNILKEFPNQCNVNRGTVGTCRQVVNNGQNLVNVVKERPLIAHTAAYEHICQCTVQFCIPFLRKRLFSLNIEIMLCKQGFLVSNFSNKNDDFES